MSWQNDCLRSCDFDSLLFGCNVAVVLALRPLQRLVLEHVERDSGLDVGFVTRRTPGHSAARIDADVRRYAVFVTCFNCCLAPALCRLQDVKIEQKKELPAEHV